MPEVANGIRRIEGFSNCYLVEEEGGSLTLVDCGFQGGGQKVLEEIGSMGKKPGDVKNIVLTHAHQDHSRGAARLRQVTGAKLACHESEVDYLEGRSRYPSRGAMRLVSAILGLFVHVAPATADVKLKDGDQVGRLSVRHTPGHTPGSVVFLDSQTLSVFSGDTVVTGKEGMEGPNKSFTMDMAEAKRSLVKISTMRFETVLPGHGGPVTAADAPQQVAKLAA
jgi:glyoxylase-like metal-dependent hydrolase (beta-lactamase superfamily II)